MGAYREQIRLNDGKLMTEYQFDEYLKPSIGSHVSSSGP